MNINRIAASAILAGVFIVGGGAGGAVAGSLVTSPDIKDGTIKLVDLSPRTMHQVHHGRQAAREVRILQHQVRDMQRHNASLRVRFVAERSAARATEEKVTGLLFLARHMCQTDPDLQPQPVECDVLFP